MEDFILQLGAPVSTKIQREVAATAGRLEGRVKSKGNGDDCQTARQVSSAGAEQAESCPRLGSASASKG
jgi:hypothetical protein